MAQSLFVAFGRANDQTPYTLPFKALNTQAMAKKPIPTAAKPQPATSSYRKAPMAISATPTTIIIKVAHANTVFLFIILYVFWAFAL